MPLVAADTGLLVDGAASLLSRTRTLLGRG
jgi:hypothetical protein